MLDLLEAVVDVGQLEGVRPQAAFEQRQLLEFTHRDVGPFDLRGLVVIGQAAGFAVLNPHHAVLTAIQLHQVGNFITGQRRNLGPFRGILSSLFKILLNFGLGHVYSVAVAHPGNYIPHLTLLSQWKRYRSFITKR